MDSSGCGEVGPNALVSVDLACIPDANPASAFAETAVMPQLGPIWDIRWAEAADAPG